MTEELPPPLVPAEVDLRDFQFMPIDIVRLFGSEFHAASSDSEWRAGVTLWLKSFHQVPAASIPDDDMLLARLAEFGRDIKAWKKVRAGSLHGWVLFSDRRWYHPVVAEKAIEAWKKKVFQRDRSKKGNEARWGKAAPDASRDHEGRLLDAIPEGCGEAPEDERGSPNGTANVILEGVQEAIPEGLPNTSPKDPKGQGQGQGQKVSKSGTGASAPLLGDIGALPEMMHPPDPLKAAFDLGVSMVVRTGKPPDAARRMVGKWRQAMHDDERLLAIITSAIANKAVDPIGYVSKAISRRSEPEQPAERAWL